VNKMTFSVLKVIGAIVIVSAITGCKPTLTQANASKLIPNGMSESDVYKMLGTSAITSTGNHGEKYLIYFFPFFEQPPGVEPKVETMTVIISNGVVIDRQFGETIHMGKDTGRIRSERVSTNNLQ